MAGEGLEKPSYNERHEQIVAALATKNKDLTRSKIIAQTKLPSGGGLSSTLRELMECGFVKEVFPFHQKQDKSLYRLVDEYSLFYFIFLQNNKLKNSWMQISNSPVYDIWSGYAFENLCLKHTSPIKKALGIHGIITNGMID